MSEEKLIDPKVITSKNDSFRKIEGKMVAMAGEQNLPFCNRCLKHDYDNGNVKEFKEYTKGEVLRKEKIKDRKTHKVLGTMIDYACPMGHGIAAEILTEDIEGMIPVLQSASKK